MESLFFPVLLVLLVAFMFFSVRKQKKRATEMQDMQNSVQTGTRVQLTSGLFGTVIDSSSSDYVDVEIATGVVTRWNRLAIMRVVLTEDAAATYPGFTPIETDDDDLDTPPLDGPNLNKSGGDSSADSDK
ncbi:preprotein translocase subunit YajC [Gordonia desulfuricans]|uniref:Preprotein translocase subunit YajC n=1 Tax=Gordonia desulfuricans TaxID=89051 RepID=A0A7K3LUT3_9ACTN|nr:MULTISPECIES: preprotein translocase subunit YajC [Gordonia]EMP14890.2 preprotein translocase subunit YajC [Gordonia sp. NB41Y]NDK92033.1 preprotein translocase subunit YajC [Gordonia desulfuricans]WLP91035.1 preprotein translocase subunit YajC [Gordonia sp. NB41Y]